MLLDGVGDLRQAAGLLAADPGARACARAPYSSSPESTGDDPPTLLLKARLCQLQGDAAVARKIIDSLLYMAGLTDAMAIESAVPFTMDLSDPAVLVAVAVAALTVPPATGQPSHVDLVRLTITLGRIEPASAG